VPDGARERVAARLGLMEAAPVQLRASSAKPPSAGALTKPALLGVAGVSVLALVFFGARAQTAPAPTVTAPAERALGTAKPAAVPTPAAGPLLAAERARPAEAAGRFAYEPAMAAREEPRKHLAAPVRVPVRAAPPPANEPRETRARVDVVEPQGGVTDDLLEEVRQLDRARADLDADRASLALAVLDDYERLFPKGQLALEATVLRASTLYTLGRRDEARALAQRLSARTDSGRYRAELERLLAR
jgi:hypothetical protein